MCNLGSPVPTKLPSVSTFTFGQNLGDWEGILGSFELNVEYVTPSTWMRHYDCKPRMERRDRKRGKGRS